MELDSYIAILVCKCGYTIDTPISDDDALVEFERHVVSKHMGN